MPKKRRVRRPRLGARSTTARTASDSSARSQRRLSSRGGPGSTTTTHPFVSSTRPGRGPGETERLRALGARRLLPHARREVRIRPSQAVGDHPRHGFDLALELGVDDERLSGDARHELDRPVVVGRPEPARDEAEVGVERLAERLSDVVGPVADDRDALGLEAEPKQPRAARNGPLRSCRSPRTSSLPVTTIAARGRAVTTARRNDSPRRDDEGRSGGKVDPVPVPAHEDVLRLGERQLEPPRLEPLALPLLERPAVEERPGGRAGAHLHPRAALGRANDERRRGPSAG